MKKENRNSQKIAKTTLGKLWEMLSSRHRKRLFLVAAALFVSAVVNVGGIASIMPFMQVLAEPSVVTGK